ncbi:helix-turn-helix transcriptional regulator [Streptomyces sp. NPDC006339]|uniref:helix-turn-helix transcriptional regulator n=1 Tax=Streptomyces sp. NPDC006339 TaxID=3156755 RepID=UPI0033B296FF
MTTGRTAPDPREARNPAEFIARLQALRTWSGLTYRELAARADARGDVLPRSTVANMLARTTVPREELLAAFVRACGVGPGAAQEWEAVRKELATRGAYEPGRYEPGADERVAGERPAGEPDRAAQAPATAGAVAVGAAGTGAGTGAAVAETAETAGAGTEAAVAETAETAGAAEEAPPVWPGAEGEEPPADTHDPGTPEAPAGPRSRLHRALVAVTGVAGLVVATLSVVAFLREDTPAHRTPPALTAPAEGPVHIRVIGSDLCLNERRGSRSGQIHQRACAGADLPAYELKKLPGDHWRIVSRHPDFGPGCSGIPSGGRIPDAALEDSECGDPSRVERFTLEPHGTPVTGYRIVPAGSATPGTCVTVVGDRTAEWSRLAQAPCTPDARGQLFSFDRREGA